MTLAVEIPLRPKPTPRARARIGTARGKLVPLMRNPKTYSDYKANARIYIRREMEERRIQPFGRSVPVALRLIYFLPRPKNAKYGEEYPIHTNAGDIDNFEKAVMDAMTEALYADDVQVVHCEHDKVYAPDGTEPRILAMAWKAGHKLHAWND